VFNPTNQGTELEVCISKCLLWISSCNYLSCHKYSSGKSIQWY
jgi:hypothetical protein